jgi:hypothetical protein
MSGTLDGGGQATLMLGAHASLSSRLDLIAVGNEPSELVNLFVVDIVNMIDTEGA